MAGNQGPAEGGGAVSVEERIVAALSPFGDPVEASLLYAAAQDLPDRYYTFQCSSAGEDFGDDEPGCELWRVSVHYFAPLYNEDISKRAKQTKKALHRAGFTWPSSTDASDQDGYHIVFECEIAEEVEPDGEIRGQWDHRAEQRSCCFDGAAGQCYRQYS